MRIKSVLLIAGLAALLAACAQAPVRGGGGDQALGGQISGASSSGTGLADYRQELSNPGWF